MLVLGEAYLIKIGRIFTRNSTDVYIMYTSVLVKMGLYPEIYIESHANKYLIFYLVKPTKYFMFLIKILPIFIPLHYNYNIFQLKKKTTTTKIEFHYKSDLL